MQDLVEFANNNVLLTTGLMASALAVIFYELKVKARNVASLGIPMAVRMMNDGGNIVDVRPADRYLDGHIVDARNIPSEELLKDPGRLASHEGNVLLICDTGSKSAECATHLRKQGNENIFNVRGGLEEWRRENLPLVSGR